MVLHWEGYVNVQCLLQIAFTWEIFLTPLTENITLRLVQKANKVDVFIYFFI